MKTKLATKPLTFGGPIENVYDACGKRRAKGILRLLTKGGLVAFHEAIVSF